MTFSIFTQRTPRLLTRSVIAFAALGAALITVIPSTVVAKDLSGFNIGSEYMNESDALDVRRRPQSRRYVAPQYYGDDQDQVYVSPRYVQPNPYYQQRAIVREPQYGYNGYGYERGYGRGYERGYGRYGGYDPSLPGASQRGFEDPQRGMR
jgi:hypothetical protein